jgi:hypothetical protein
MHLKWRKFFLKKYRDYRDMSCEEKRDGVV